MFLDLSEVKVESNFKAIPAGTYTVILDDCEVKQTKSGTGEYINCKFKIIGGEYDDKILYHMFNIKNENQEAVKIGLSQLRTFMECAGIKDLKLKSVVELVGYKAMATVKNKTDSYGEKAVISYFKPFDADNTVTKGAVPF